MQRHLKTEAVVLKRKYLLNRDAFITLFTQEEGKITATAKRGAEHGKPADFIAHDR